MFRWEADAKYLHFNRTAQLVLKRKYNTASDLCPFLKTASHRLPVFSKLHPRIAKTCELSLFAGSDGQVNNVHILVVRILHTAFAYRALQRALPVPHAGILHQQPCCILKHTLPQICERSSLTVLKDFTLRLTALFEITIGRTINTPIPIHIGFYNEAVLGSMSH